jgi:hypothetical protein
MVKGDRGYYVTHELSVFAVTVARTPPAGNAFVQVVDGWLDPDESSMGDWYPIERDKFYRDADRIRLMLANLTAAVLNSVGEVTRAEIDGGATG